MSGIGDFIKNKREEKGLNITSLSRLSGVSRPYLSQIEAGKRKPSSDILNKIAKPLGVSPLTLMYKAEYAEKEEVESIQRAEKLLKEVDKYKDENYYYDSPKSKKDYSDEFRGVSALLELNYRSVLNNSDDIMLNEVEKTIIREHLSELLSNYKMLLERYRNAKLNWGHSKNNFIEVYRKEMSLEEIKELYFKQFLENELSKIKGNIDAFPMWITRQPDFLRAASLKKRLQRDQDN